MCVRTYVRMCVCVSACVCVYVYIYKQHKSVMKYGTWNKEFL
jgi:hypothetical protein